MILPYHSLVEDVEPRARSWAGQSVSAPHFERPPGVSNRERFEIDTMGIYSQSFFKLQFETFCGAPAWIRARVVEKPEDMSSVEHVPGIPRLGPARAHAATPDSLARDWGKRLVWLVPLIWGAGLFPGFRRASAHRGSPARQRAPSMAARLTQAPELRDTGF